MKSIIIVIFSIFLTSKINAQLNNYFPLAVGNEWLYYEGGYSNHFGNFASINTISVIKDTVIENRKYFRLSKYPSDWIRYDTTENRVYVYWNDSDRVYIDFNAEADSAYIQFLPSSHTLRRVNAIKSSENIFSDTIEVLGYGYTLREGNNVDTESFEYAENYGLVVNTDYSYSIGPGGTINTYTSLVQYISYDSSSTPHYYSYNYYPEIIFKPDSAIKDSIFNIDFQIDDNYSSFYGMYYFNFVDSVKLLYYYQKGDSCTESEIENIPNSDYHGIDYNYNLVLNYKLMKEGYKLKYKIVAKDRGIIPHYSSSPDTGYYSLKYDSTLTDVKINNKPGYFSLYQNFPNPFNPSTDIKYVINKTSFVTLKIFDILGREVATLINEEKSPGTYNVEFSAENLSSGVYIYQLKAGGFIQSKKMIVLR